MTKPTPLKRHPALQHLSHDHHHGLLLCWKIRQGFKLGVDPDRMKAYSEWFWNHHLEVHFREEEEQLFPILVVDNPLIKQALSEHRRLKNLFTKWENIEKNLGQIEEELEQHIRFEERTLFPLIQENASSEQLEAIAQNGNQEKFQDNDSDPFWIKLT
ncbi:MAG: hemerythrin domain-containing protein [Algoriphagus sp.]|nr:hemerythrin domain-containing protein [Algoriphagus sp.]